MASEGQERGISGGSSEEEDEDAKEKKSSSEEEGGFGLASVVVAAMESVFGQPDCDNMFLSL